MRISNSPPRPPREARQRGAALLIVLVLVATISVVALGLTNTMTRAVTRAGAAHDRDQAVWMLLGAEEAALYLLEQQDLTNPGVDTPEERWLAAPIMIPLEFGVAQGAFTDRSACFNLNGLVSALADEGITANPAAIKSFGRMLLQMGADPRSGELLASAVADFIDSDDRAEPGGAEDFVYNRKAVPYRTAGTLLKSVSEVRAIKGWGPSAYQLLAPMLCTPPGKAGNVQLNVNTMTLGDAPLLQVALGEAISLAAAERIIENRPLGGYPDVQTFLGQSAFSSLQPPLGPEVAGRLSTHASYLEFNGQVAYDRRKFEMTSMITNIKGNGPKVTNRRFGGGDL